MSKAIVLLSGGLDSTTVLALAAKENGELLTLSCFYGQKHAVEIECAQVVAEYYGVGHRVINLPPVFLGGGSTLVDVGLEQPHHTYKELMELEGPSPTVVPFRNANLIAAATSVAAAGDYHYIYVAVHADDAHNWAYPDCTPEFMGAMANAVYIGTYHKVRLRFPFVWMRKADIVKLGAKLGVPFEKTHSCYDGKRPACGLCPTCIERIEAFKANGLEDSIAYEIPVDWERA